MTVKTPDWIIWNSAETATLDQCALLVLSIDPEAFDSDSEYFPSEEIEAKYGAYLAVLKNNATANNQAHALYLTNATLGKRGKVSLRRFVEWAKNKGWPVPEELQGAEMPQIVVDAPVNNARADSAATEKNPSTLKMENLLKAFYGVCIKGYSYDPDAKKNPAIKEIVDDLKLLGIETTDDTIRNYLTEAKQLVPPKKS